MMWLTLAILWAASAALMAILWVRQLKTENANAVDVAWSALIGVHAIVLAVVGEGDTARRAALAVVAGGWSLRLTAYLYFTRVRGEAVEDGRYRTLRATWSRAVFFVFYQAQALLTVILAVPFALIAANPAAGLGPLEIAGIALWVVALVGESIADAQLSRFRRDPANRGRTCRVGLWRYSRHPNYLFQWLIWCGTALVALAAPGGWVALAAPAMMLFFIFKITGIPPTEAQALVSRGDDYRDYQRTVPAFFPWYPKASDAGIEKSTCGTTSSSV
jgi:steroid 5-alpha reductase family enzyme